MKLFSPFPSLQVAYSHRTDGSFRDRDSIQVFLASSINQPLSHLKLEHSSKNVLVEKRSDDIQHGDGIMTNLKDQTLSFVVGDCFPVILFDPNNHVFALLHCGWKSLVQNLIALSLEQMHNTYQTQAEDVQVWVGPGICSEHYTQEEKPDQLDLLNWQSCISKNEQQMYSIDLAKYIKQELIRLCIQENNIIDEQLCTYELKNNLFSHRRATIENEADGRFIIAAWQN